MNYHLLRRNLKGKIVKSDKVTTSGAGERFRKGKGYEEPNRTFVFLWR
jgi:hypothetical protein